VSVSVAGAQTGLVLANGALKSAEALDAACHPEVRFVTNRVTLAEDERLSGGATISGRVTPRGVTRPLTLNANVFRRPGSAPDDLNQLTVSLSGALNRSDFGANGYAGLVANRVTLDITAAIRIG